MKKSPKTETSRRQFIKSGAKVLPALAIIGMAAAVPTPAYACGSNDCGNTCSDNCQGGCSGNCQTGCGYDCQNSCNDLCLGGNEINGK